MAGPTAVKPADADPPKRKPAAKKRPPRDEREPQAPPPPQTAPSLSRSDAELAERLAALYGTAGMALAGAGQASGKPGLVLAGVNIMTRAEPVAVRWIEVGNQNPKIKRALQRFVETTATAMLIGEHAEMLAPVASGIMGDDAPEMLKAAANQSISDDAKMAAVQLFPSMFEVVTD